MQLPDWMQPKPRILDLETIIEEAARKCVPWPEQEYIINWDTDESRPQTLEDFVNGTYIADTGGADKVFRAAAHAAALAVRDALREAGWPNRIGGE